MTEQFYKDQLYVRATGVNILMGGSPNWLKIKRIEDRNDEYELWVTIRGFEKSVGIPKEWIKSGVAPENLKFRVHGQPCSIRTVLMHYYGWNNFDHLTSPQSDGTMAA